MKVVDKRVPKIVIKRFHQVPVGTIFEFPKDSKRSENFGVCMKISSEDDGGINAVTLQDCTFFDVEVGEEICELNAYLVIERRD